MTNTDVHFIWLGGSLPAAHARELERFRSLNPNLRIRLWSDIPEAMPGELKQLVYHAAPMLCQKADIIRVWLLHEFGGMYFDTDIAWVSSVEPLRARDRFWAARSHQHVSNFALGTPAGDPLLAEYLRLIRERAATGAYGDRACYRQCLGMALLNSFDHSFSAPASVTPYTPRVDAGGPHRLIPHAVEANDLLMEPGGVLRDGNTVEGKTLRFSGQNGFEHRFVAARSYALTG